MFPFVSCNTLFIENENIGSGLPLFAGFRLTCWPSIIVTEYDVSYLFVIFLYFYFNFSGRCRRGDESREAVEYEGRNVILVNGRYHNDSWTIWRKFILVGLLSFNKALCTCFLSRY